MAAACRKTHIIDVEADRRPVYTGSAIVTAFGSPGPQPKRDGWLVDGRDQRLPEL
jgi:hypothetical protein